MCEICGKWACPPNCPGYGEGESERCGICGERLHEGEVVYEMDGKPYCAMCVEGADLEELVRICESEDAEALLENLGIVRKAFAHGKEYYGG